MPRGFLVKRSKRTSPASYRMREADSGGGVPVTSEASYSPIKPVGSDQGKSFFERCLSSPATAESFPTCAPVASMERLLSSPADPKFNTPVHLCAPLDPNTKRSCFDPDRKAKPAAKKPKVTRKLSFEDEVTISPVLGLKIKKEGPESKTPSSARRKPLGEFICQLCKEEYPDPFSLAQHKCSRIVRVEYRCPDCDKVFSCPANLASHRRWHKPRPMNHAELGGKKEPEKLFPGCSRAADAIAGSYLLSACPPEEVYECQYCEKKFRRQAYLKKHQAAHETLRSASYNQIESGQITFPCQLCGAHFPSVEIRDKHRLWHAQIFSCKHCPSTFFSSPGLTRHINKAHPTESRQVMLLQMAVRPGC
uniref:INSM transcriptional repressor 2 n=1 Tax=Paramormyrops kingsleyae TaxID=1676925 RepID=A0A3B3SD47_9TELE